MKSGVDEFVPFARAGSLYAHMKSSMTHAEWKMRASDLVWAALEYPDRNVIAIRAALATGGFRWILLKHVKTWPIEVVRLFLASGNFTRSSFAHMLSSGCTDSCAYLMIANGFRVPAYMSLLHSFQQGILRCRRAVVALWLLRKRGVNLDKFLARELALAVWTTRCDWEK